MKIKNLIAIFSICTIAFANAAFIYPSNSIVEKPELPKITDQSFIDFLSLFEKVDMPFKIGLNDFEKYYPLIDQSKFRKKRATHKNTRKQLLQQYLINNTQKMISRMGPPQAMPVARFYPNDKMVAVVYISYLPHFGLKNLTFELSLFDLKGKIISNKKTAKGVFNWNKSFVLGHTSPHSTSQTFTINPDGYIWQHNYNKQWEKDIKKHGVKDNRIVGYDLKTTNVFQIQENGLITEAKEYPVLDRASIK